MDYVFQDVYKRQELVFNFVLHDFSEARYLSVVLKE